MRCLKTVYLKQAIYYSKYLLTNVFFGTAIFVPFDNINIFDAEFISLFYKLLLMVRIHYCLYFKNNVKFLFFTTI